MKIIIDIPDNMQEMCQWHKDGICSLTGIEMNIIAEAIVKGRAFPGNAINGNVLRMVFPNIDFYEDEIDKIGGLISFYAKDKHEKKRQRVIITADWWNAPYKGDK